MYLVCGLSDKKKLKKLHIRNTILSWNASTFWKISFQLPKKAYSLHRQSYSFLLKAKKPSRTKFLRHSSFRGASGTVYSFRTICFSFLNHFKTFWEKTHPWNFGSLGFRTLKFGLSEILRTSTCISLLGSPIPFSYSTKANRGENPK